VRGTAANYPPAIITLAVLVVLGTFAVLLVLFVIFS